MNNVQDDSNFANGSAMRLKQKQRSYCENVCKCVIENAGRIEMDSFNRFATLTAANDDEDERWHKRLPTTTIRRRTYKINRKNDLT